MIGRSTQLIRSRSLLAGDLDGVLGVLLAQALEFLVATLDVGDEPLDEAAVLNVLEDGAHPVLGVGVDDARTGDVAAELRGVGHRVVHPGDATLVHQVDDQLELVQHLEVRHLGGVSRLDHDVEAGLDQFLGAAAQHGLLTEQVGLGLFLERGLDDAGAGAADALGVGQRQRLALTLGSWSMAIRQGTPLPSTNWRRTRWPGPFGATMPMVTLAGGLIRSKWMLRPWPKNSALPSSRFGSMSFLKISACAVSGASSMMTSAHLATSAGVSTSRPCSVTFSRDLEPSFRPTFTSTPGVAQAQRVRVPLAAVADDADLASLDDRQVCVVVVEHLNCHFDFLLCIRVSSKLVIG